MNKKIILIIGGVVVALLAIVLLIPASASQCYNDGRHALLTGKFDDARKYLTKALARSQDPHLTGEILVSMAECADKEGKSVEYLDYMRQAALLFNPKGLATYEVYLQQFPELKQEYIDFYTELSRRRPQDSKYAAKLAKPYLFDSGLRDWSKAGECLLPFVSRSGSGVGDVNTRAYAAYLLASGSGGYVQSPEASVMLSSMCRKNIDNVLNDPDVDAEALNILGDMALAECAYDTSIDMVDNVIAARRFFNAALKKAAPGLAADIEPKVKLLEAITTELSKVVISPHWWDKKPNDWTSYFNQQTGFRYVGHTNVSGVVHAPSGANQYPTGWGIGAWTKDKSVFVGKWNNGNIDKGIYVFESCNAVMYGM